MTHGPRATFAALVSAVRSGPRRGLWHSIPAAVKIGVPAALAAVMVVVLLLAASLALLLSMVGSVLAPVEKVVSWIPGSSLFLPDEANEVLGALHDQATDDEIDQLRSGYTDAHSPAQCLTRVPPVRVPADPVRLRDPDAALIEPGTQVVRGGTLRESVGTKVLAQIPSGADAETARDFAVVALAGGTRGWDRFTQYTDTDPARFFAPGTDLSPYRLPAAALVVPLALADEIGGDAGAVLADLTDC